MGQIHVLLILVTVGMTYLLFMPFLPDEIEDPIKIRLFCAPFTICNAFGKFSEFFGYTRISCLKLLINNAVSFNQYPDLNITDQEFDGVLVRIYEPKDREPNGPAIVYLHGGGWAIGTLDAYHGVTSRLANKTNYLVVSVSYRLAPEFPYPIPLDDCVTAVRFLRRRAADFGVDPDRVAVMGDSAGGNLAAAVSLKLRDENRYQLKLQILINAALQAWDFNTPSYQAYSKYYIMINTELIAAFWLTYALGDAFPWHTFLNATVHNQHISGPLRNSRYASFVSRDMIHHSYWPKDYEGKIEYSTEIPKLSEKLEKLVVDPYFSPLMAEDLYDLPKTLIINSEFDVLRDDGVLFRKRLEKFRNDVTYKNYENGWHGLTAVPTFLGIKLNDVLFHDVVDYIKANL